MKKILYFAIALVAGALAFTSCDKKDKVDSPLVGTWFMSEGEQDYFYTFNADGSYQRVEDYYMYGRATVAHEHIVGDGSFKIDGDVIDATLNSILVYMDGSAHGDDFSEFWPSNEKMKFKLEGDKLTLTHDYDTGDAWSEVLTRKGKPVDPEPSDIDIDPATLVNTEWRTDSCFMNGQKTQPPHLYIEILSEDAALINGENHNFVINKDKMTCTWFENMVFTFVEASEGWAHVKGDNGSDIYLSKLPAKDFEAQIMDQQASDFVGTWKLAYYTYSNNNSGYDVRTAGTNPGTETWEFKADGTCIYNSWFSGETVTGTWEHSYFEIKFTKNPAIGVITEDEMITVQPLTPNWMCLYRSTNGGTQNYQWWFVRVQ